MRKLLLLALSALSLSHLPTKASAGHLNKGSYEGAPAMRAAGILEKNNLGSRSVEKVTKWDFEFLLKKSQVKDLFCCVDSANVVNYCQDSSGLRVRGAEAKELHETFFNFWAYKRQNWQVCDDGARAPYAIERINCSIMEEDFEASCFLETWMFTD